MMVELIGGKKDVQPKPRQRATQYGFVAGVKLIANVGKYSGGSSEVLFVCPTVAESATVDAVHAHHLVAVSDLAAPSIEDMEWPIAEQRFL